ncbi:RHS repeat protein [Kosakonia sacchari]|uniref:RHS repeat protein n=1 Tax=Kosakonia sacchari TaxID=1158459 RepID=UPI0025B0D34B|nr:RHS repeat domain-containing protein [Kosakonia sacchari]MDN2484987.1 RHS repeat protein [Kosakonia sacchari]
MSTSLFSKTPMVTVLDNRGLIVREVSYHRHPDSPDTTSERTTHHQYNARGFLLQSADPRLYDTGLANFSYLTGLTGNVLRTQGVDNGTSVALNDAAGRSFMTISNIDTADDGTENRNQAVTRTWQYEDASLPGRPISITEQVNGEAGRIAERFVYAGNSDAEKAQNLAGLVVSYYDTAGLIQRDSVALTGVLLCVTRRLLKDADDPNTEVNWQGQDASAWNDVLEAKTYITLTTSDATGAILSTTDAAGHQQRMAYDVAGMMSGSWLTVKGGTEQIIVKSLTYSAAGQKLREEHGNGVVTTYLYEPETQRLVGIKTARPEGHASGAKVLQDLRYEYDPVGNVLSISNDAEETRFWRNQKVVPENTYSYDSLYQLISATGREMANADQQGSNLPSFIVPLPTDSSAYTCFIRTYRYDNGGNLIQIRHSAPATNHSYTTDITVSDRSNRGVLSTLTTNPSDVDALFTAGGQQKQLLAGQPLVWTSRNELQRVSPVTRDDSADDQESYRYDGGSQRLLKVGIQKTSGSTQTQRVLYLPGLELRSTTNGAAEESLQVIIVGEAGRAQVRVLHWESGKPADIANDQTRYSYDNLVGSSQLELSGEGEIISMEEYYPYGGTALLTARSQAEVNYKTMRYSGKERDATGLYYYGFRYYQPWAGRWLSSDRAGTLDGLNLYRMVRNNPVTLSDKDGLMPRKALDDEEQGSSPSASISGNTEIKNSKRNDRRRRVFSPEEMSQALEALRVNPSEKSEPTPITASPVEESAAEISAISTDEALAQADDVTESSLTAMASNTRRKRGRRVFTEEQKKEAIEKIKQSDFKEPAENVQGEHMESAVALHSVSENSIKAVDEAAAIAPKKPEMILLEGIEMPLASAEAMATNFLKNTVKRKAKHDKGWNLKLSLENIGRAALVGHENNVRDFIDFSQDIAKKINTNAISESEFIDELKFYMQRYKAPTSSQLLH